MKVSISLLDPSEVAKLQKHLSLLRHEYVKLQSKLVEMEQKFSLASAASGDLDKDSFIAQLLRLIADLFDKDSFRCSFCYIYLIVIVLKIAFQI